MLHTTIREEIKEALKAKEEVRLSVLRGIIASCTNELVATKRTPQQELSDQEVLAVIKRLAKQRKDSIEQFRSGGREDLVESESAELAILETYLPKLMGIEEILPIAKAKAQELHIENASQSGQLMGALMKELKGAADGTDVKAAVDTILQ